MLENTHKHWEWRNACKITFLYLFKKATSIVFLKINLWIKCNILLLISTHIGSRRFVSIKRLIQLWHYQNWDHSLSIRFRAEGLNVDIAIKYNKSRSLIFVFHRVLGYNFIKKFLYLKISVTLPRNRNFIEVQRKIIINNSLSLSFPFHMSSCLSKYVFIVRSPFKFQL